MRVSSPLAGVDRMGCASETVEGFCPECNRVISAEVRAEASGGPPTELFEAMQPSEEGLRGARYAIAFCPKCRRVFLHVRCESEPSDIPHETMLYPSIDRRSIPDLPTSVRRTYNSAISCFDTGNYEPSVVMSRKCLESVCVNLGQDQGVLAKRLQALRDSGKIEERMYKWADELRLIGNEGAHDLDQKISKDDARDCLDFVEAILLYVFVLDEKFRKLKERRQRGC